MPSKCAVVEYAWSQDGLCPVSVLKFTCMHAIVQAEFNHSD